MTKKKLFYTAPALRPLNTEVSFTSCVDGSSATAGAGCEGGSAVTSGQCSIGDSAVASGYFFACNSGNKAVNYGDVYGCGTGNDAAGNSAHGRNCDPGNTAGAGVCATGTSAA